MNQNQTIIFDSSRRRFNDDLKNFNKKVINIKGAKMSTKRKEKRVIKKYIIKPDIINDEMLLIDIIERKDNIFTSIHIIENFILNATNSLDAWCDAFKRIIKNFRIANQNIDTFRQQNEKFNKKSIDFKTKSFHLSTQLSNVNDQLSYQQEINIHL